MMLEYCQRYWPFWGELISDSKVHGANMGPIWGWQDPGGPHVGPMNFAFWDWYYPDKGPVIWNLNVFVISLNKLLNK